MSKLPIMSPQIEEVRRELEGFLRLVDLCRDVTIDSPNWESIYGSSLFEGDTLVTFESGGRKMKMISTSISATGAGGICPRYVDEGV